jgi:hypothetical protein
VEVSGPELGREGRASATPLALILIGYVLAAVWVLPLVRWQLNPDGVSYILAARRILSGDFLGAASAHWSPLFSWMLVPLLAARIEPLLACKLLTDAIGAATIVAMWLIAPLFARRRSVQIIVTAAFAPIVLAWASSLITPDLLLVCVLLFYLRAIFRSAGDRRTTIVAGLLGGLAYLAKAYALPFVVAHFTLVHAVRWMRGSRRTIAARFLTGMAAFLAVALPWMTTISLKYGHLTASTTASYNWYLIGPLARGRHPVQTYGLIPPPDARASSIWDDPSALRFPPWPAEGKRLVHLGQHAIGNAVRILGIMESWSLLAIPILLIAVYRAGRRRIIAWTLVTGALYAAGFLSLFLDERYIWTVEALLLLIAAAVFDDLADSPAIPRTALGVLGAIVVLSFIVRPLQVPRSVNQSGRIARQQADDLAKSAVDLHDKRLASNDPWEWTIFLNYYLGAHYYGMPRPGQDALAIRRELDRNGIDAFIVWRDGRRPAYLDGFHLTGVSPHSFALYERTKCAPPCQVAP